MILLRQINADIRQGILQKWKVFLITTCISLGLTVLFLYTTSGLITKGRITGSVSLGDVFYYMFRGMKEYDPKTGELFDIVDSFLIWNLLLAFIISYYPVRELRNTGKIYLTRANSRIQWWLSKCVWNILTVSLFYLCIFVGMVIGGFISSFFFDHITASSFLFNPEIFKKVFKQEFTQGMQKYIMAQIMILPFVASLAISMFQMAVEFIFNEPISYIAVIVICGFSAYYMKWFLIGNGMMVYRYFYVNPKGMGIVLPLLASGVIFTLSIVVGYISFRNKDIL